MRAASAPEKARLLGKVLREARDWEVWNFTTPGEVTRLWRQRPFWKFLLHEWWEQGRLSSCQDADSI